jgi:hypothetical protein
MAKRNYLVEGLSGAERVRGYQYLRIDEETMRRRLQERTDNDFGKQPEEVETMLKLNRRAEKPGRSDRCRRNPASQPGGRRTASPSSLNKAEWC